jgi:4-hydroxy-3-polyprenylbenzoate decarboxylase
VKELVLGVTGASGVAYGRRLAQYLVAQDLRVHLVVSPAAQQIMAEELGLREFSTDAFLGRTADNLTLHAYDDMGACITSGSFLTAGMVICPCSMRSLAAIASGLGDNVITRAALVTLKEGRRLVLVPREMPLSPVDLENMLKLSRAGVIICPACPGFYHKPQSIDGLIDFVVGRVLDLLGFPHALNTRWAPPTGSNRPPDPPAGNTE